jgi:hypothetical protein
LKKGENIMFSKTVTVTAAGAVIALFASGAAFANEVKAPEGFCTPGSTPTAPGLVLKVKWDDGKGYDAIYNGTIAYVWGLSNGKVVNKASAIEVVDTDTIYGCWVDSSS